MIDSTWKSFNTRFYRFVHVQFARKSMEALQRRFMATICHMGYIYILGIRESESMSLKFCNAIPISFIPLIKIKFLRIFKRMFRQLKTIVLFIMLIYATFRNLEVIIYSLPHKLSDSQLLTAFSRTMTAKVS